MTPKPIKKAIRFLESLIFVSTPPKPRSRTRSVCSLTVESPQSPPDPYQRSYMSLGRQRPKCAPPGNLSGGPPSIPSGVPPSISYVYEIPTVTPTVTPSAPPQLPHLTELESLVLDLETYSTAVDDLESQPQYLSLYDYEYTSTYV